MRFRSNCRHDFWEDAFNEMRSALIENREPNQKMFDNLTKATGERPRCPKCGKKIKK